MYRNIGYRRTKCWWDRSFARGSDFPDVIPDGGLDDVVRVMVIKVFEIAGPEQNKIRD